MPSSACFGSLEATVETDDVVTGVDLAQGHAEKALGGILARKAQENKPLVILVEARDVSLDLVQLERRSRFICSLCCCLHRSSSAPC